MCFSKQTPKLGTTQPRVLFCSEFYYVQVANPSSTIRSHPMRNYTKKYRTRCGFSREIFSVLKEQPSSRDILKRHGQLLVDEMKLSEKHSVMSGGHIYGFIDFCFFTLDTDKHAVYV